MPSNLLLSAVCILTAILVSALGLLCLVHYRTRSARALAALLFASGIYSFGYAFEVMQGSLPWIWFWLRIEYIGIAPISSCWLWLALAFTGSVWLQRRTTAILLAGVPTAFFLLVQTNPLHHLFYSYLSTTEGGPFTAALIGRGPAYLALSAWTMASFLIGMIVYWRYYLRVSPAFKRQSAFMLIGSWIPVVYYMVFMAELIPWGIDGAPPVIGLASCLFAWAILKAGLLDISPIARERIFSTMQDGVVVTDRQDYIADWNPTAASFLPQLDQNAIGQPLFSLLPELRSFSPARAERTTATPLIKMQDGDEQAYNVWRVDVSAHDYRLIGSAWYIRRITEERRLLTELQLRATRDALTGIYNRRRWDELSAELFQQANLESGPLALLWIDIDHFKQANDCYGHAVGDLLLAETAQIITGCLSAGEVLGRIGGEEFAVTVPPAFAPSAERLAIRILQAVSTHVFQYAQLPPLRISVSIGVGMRPGGSSESFQELTRKADQAMYEAKHHGRNQVRISGSCASIAQVPEK